MASLFAAPAIVSAQNLMPVKVIPFDPYMLVRGIDLVTREWTEVRVYETAGDPFAFLSPDFHEKLLDASRGMGISQTGVVTSREEEKEARMFEIGGPVANRIAKGYHPLGIQTIGRGRDNRCGLLTDFM
jgi:hypothetical protein